LTKLLRLTLEFKEVRRSRIWVKSCKDFPLNSCYLSRRLKGGEPARRGRGFAKQTGEVFKNP